MSVLVGYDGTACADVALDEALRLSSDLGTGVALVFAYAVNRAGGEVSDYATALQDHAKEVLARGAERVQAAGGTCTTESIEARDGIAQALAQAAERHDARMIVVGSGRESPLKAIVLGSTPYRLLHVATRPVLVVSPQG